MKVVFDTDVILDVMLNREPFAKAAIQLMNAVEKRICSGAVCATTVTNLFYIGRQAKGAEATREDIRRLLILMDVATVNKRVLQSALADEIQDFEDAVVHQSALDDRSHGIVTRNKGHFAKARLPVFTPEELLAML